MSPETIKSLAEEIVNQTILDNWFFYIVLACITVFVSSVGAFLSSYYVKRAEIRAITADFEELKRQLKETTLLSESIKSDINRIADRTEKLQWQKRKKLEDYLVFLLGGVEHLSKDMYHKYFDSEKPDQENPLDRASMLQDLYLPELDKEHAAFILIVVDFSKWVIAGMQQRVGGKRADGVNQPPAKEHLDEYPVKLKELHAGLRPLKQAAIKLSCELNNS